MIAVNTLREQPHYRRSAFTKGLERLGYKMERGGSPRSRSDLLILWNRQSTDENQARDWESNGGSVLVCENGYIGADDQGRSLYAISVHGHNGSGWFPVGTEDRFTALGVQVQPWRDLSGHVLVCGQRGIGSRLMASPANWEHGMAQKLKGRWPVRMRSHPGRTQPATTLQADLEGAAACYVWSSASGVKALTVGVPVIYAAPHWICSAAASRDLSAPMMDDALRQAALHRMAHAQWTVAEIESGEPFARIVAQIGEAKW